MGCGRSRVISDSNEIVSFIDENQKTSGRDFSRLWRCSTGADATADPSTHGRLQKSEVKKGGNILDRLPPRQDVIHPGLSGSRGQPRLGVGMFSTRLVWKLPGQALNP